MMNNQMQYEVRPLVRAEDLVAQIMWRDPVVLPPKFRINEAIERVRQVGLPNENMNHCYVVDEDCTLLGQLSLRELLLTRGGKRVEDVMERPFVTLQPSDDQELAAQMMQEYDLLELPVVDERNRLVGVVTADDAMEVLQEEATEDMERMAAMVPSERPYLESSVRRIFLDRIPWLLLLMLSAAFTGGIIAHFEDALAAQVALTAFIPMLMDTGGNCGSQSATLIIRGLALDEIHFRDLFRVIFKEFRISLICGGVLAAANGIRILIMYRDPQLALVIALSLIATVIISKLIGCMLPLFAEKLHLDPALMASPLITTLVDTFSILIYFNIATMLFQL